VVLLKGAPRNLTVSIWCLTGSWRYVKGEGENSRKERKEAPDVSGLLGSFVLCLRTGETVRCAR
jgi:hypothetical protein